MSLETRPRVLLADDHPAIVAAVERLLRNDCDVIGSVSDGLALVEAATRLRPDVIVLDLNMPHLNGLEVCRRLARAVPRMKIVLYSAMLDADIAQEARAAGASAFVSKYAAPDDLLAVIRDTCSRDA